MRLVWIFIDPAGRIFADDFRTEEQAWEAGMNRPTEEEIEAAKNRGCRVVRATIDVDGPWDESVGILWRRLAQPNNWFYGTSSFTNYIQGEKYEYKSIYASPTRLRMLARHLVEYLDRHVPSMDLNHIKEEVRMELDKP